MTTRTFPEDCGCAGASDGYDAVMDSVKLKFSLLTLLALALVVASGITLKTNTDLSRAQQLIWGAIFVAGCLTFVKGIKLIGRR